MVGLELKSYSEIKPFGLEVQGKIDCRQNCNREFSRWNCLEAIADLGV